MTQTDTPASWAQPVSGRVCGLAGGQGRCWKGHSLPVTSFMSADLLWALLSREKGDGRWATCSENLPAVDNARPHAGFWPGAGLAHAEPSPGGGGGGRPPEPMAPPTHPCTQLHTVPHVWRASVPAGVESSEKRRCGASMPWDSALRKRVRCFGLM